MEELRKKLFELINTSNLPAEAIYYICKDFYREVQDSYFKYLNSVTPRVENSDEE